MLVKDLLNGGSAVRVGHVAMISATKLGMAHFGVDDQQLPTL
eukprot:CAMPEP_0201892326 /NCGR_PEP_ID=MMETSP0902-20130614/36236_1 /ASSEMBLY_ACC=CAM_ASM_000551 /TAXON_ID=420261 /ORGANISM="Thalassiosira antarctica, Strain CCMP982" /LENGTH=41 /DNA_ID= /DNA_START= /DNA_END= /DNA_ORIENTATION=